MVSGTGRGPKQEEPGGSCCHKDQTLEWHGTSNARASVTERMGPQWDHVPGQVKAEQFCASYIQAAYRLRHASSSSIRTIP
mmetsp:Transcript_143339/g.250213  ORF Transcript_143339/g.250213 Transcript_143339/m.250213 type:complete len:81 (+) Transcript_143339:48-290(+)